MIPEERNTIQPPKFAIEVPVDEFAIEVPVDEVLEALDHGSKWVQGTWLNGEGMCLHQGIRACQRQAGDAFLIEQVAAFQGWGTSFNDRPETTFDAVKQSLVEHREILPDELDSVFGPNWLAIVRIVRALAAATPEQIEALAAAGDATWAAAGAAARAAVRAAAWNAAGDAAWAAAGNAAGDAAAPAARAAAGNAARAAAWAAVTRDLIGTSDYTQAHYDLLAAQYVAVFGDPFEGGV